MEQLRTLVMPNVIIDEGESVLQHLASILEDEVLYPATDEPDPDQPPA